MAFEIRCLSADASLSGPWFHSASKWKTWPKACTPASVLPLPWIRVGVPRTASRRASIVSWTEFPWAWLCQPVNPLPS